MSTSTAPPYQPTEDAPSPRPSPPAGAREKTGYGFWACVVVAAWFGLHPLHVESVAWVAERKDVLSGFFFLLTLWAYAKHVMRDGCRVTGGKAGNTASLVTRLSSRYYWLAVGFFALGLMCKPMLVTLPCVLLLLDWWPLGRLRIAGSGDLTGDLKPETGNLKPETGDQKLETGNLKAGSGGAAAPPYQPTGDAPSPRNPNMVNLTPHPQELISTPQPSSGLRPPSPAPASEGQGPLPIGSADSADAEREKRSQRQDEASRGMVQASGFRFQVSKSLLVEKIPFFLLATVSCGVTYQVQHAGGALIMTDSFPPEARVGNALVSYVRYLGQTFWPADLAIFYPHPGEWPLEQVLLAAALLGGISWFCFRRRRQEPYLLMGWLWFLGMLVPVIGLVQAGEQAMADRYTYLPLLGVFLALAWGGGKIAESRKQKPESEDLTGNLKPETGNLKPETGDLKTESGKRKADLTTKDTKHTKGGLTAENAESAKGNAESEQIEHPTPNIQHPTSKGGVTEGGGAAAPPYHAADEAVVERAFTEDVAPSPQPSPPMGAREKTAAVTDRRHNIWAGSLLAAAGLVSVVVCAVLTSRQLGHWQSSETIFRHTLAVTRENAFARNNLGIAVMNRGAFGEAIGHFQEAARLKPAAAEIHSNLGQAYLNDGQLEAAIAQLQEALRWKPWYAPAHANLGLTYFKQGDMDGAIRAFEETLQLKPDFTEARVNLGVARLQKGDVDAATELFEAALRVKPDDGNTRFNLGVAYYQQGRLDAALEQFQAAARLNPGDAEIQARLKVATELQRVTGLITNDPAALNNTAWELATSPSAAIRSGGLAVPLAEQACTLTQNRVTMMLGTLAAAYAEAGRFDEAAATAQKAIALAQERGETELQKRNEELLKRYQNRQPYHEKGQ